MDKRILWVFLLVLFFSGTALAGNLKVNSVSYAPAPAAPGSLITMWAQIENDSFYEAEDVVVRLQLDFPFSLQPGEVTERTLGTMAAYETTSLEFKVLVDEKARHGAHSVKVLIGEEIPIKEESFTVEVLSRTPKLEIVESSLTEISPGSVQGVMLGIKNIGGSIAKDIVLKINPERTVTSTGIVVEREIVSLGASSNYINNLDQGEKATVELTLAVNQNAELKNYSIPVTIEYFDQNGTEKTETGYLGLKVSAEAEVDAVINSITPRAFPGGNSEIVVDLFNIGLAEASYVVVELSGQNMSIAEPRQFIGTLEADDFDSFKTKVSFKPEMPVGENTLSLNIIYKDEELQERIIKKNLAVNVLNMAEATGGSVNIGGAILGLIGLVLQLVGLYVVVLKWGYPKIKEFRAKGKK